MKKYCLFLSLVIFASISCKKEKADDNKVASSDFTTCNCSVADPAKPMPEEYVKATINGMAVCADIKGNFQGSFDNMLTYGTIKRSTGDTYYDNLYMIRYTNDGKFMFSIFLENTHLLTKQCPYQLPRPNPEFCEVGVFQVENQQKLTANMCLSCADNYWHYYGAFFQNQIRLIADKFENGFFEGRFEGTIQTGSGKYATVKDGRFRMRLTMIQRDIVIP